MPRPRATEEHRVLPLRVQPVSAWPGFRSVPTPNTQDLSAISKGAYREYQN